YPSRPCLGFNGCFSLGDLPPGDGCFVQFLHGGEVAQFQVKLLVDRERHRDFEARKRRKLDGIRSLLCCPACQSGDVFAAARDQTPVCSGCGAVYRFTGKAYDFLMPTLLHRGGVPPPTDNVSQWGYNAEMLELIHAQRGGWVLDSGAGL